MSPYLAMTVAISMHFPTLRNGSTILQELTDGFIFIRNTGWSSVRGRANIGIRLGQRTINNNYRVIISHCGGGPVFLFCVKSFLK